MEDCVFCKIVRKEIPARIVFENDRLLAFEDIRPQAPIHVQIITKDHWESLNEIPGSEQNTLGEILARAREIAREKGVSESGYRIVLNTAKDSGQEVLHIHFHLLGGRRMTWPPG